MQKRKIGGGTLRRMYERFRSLPESHGELFTENEDTIIKEYMRREGAQNLTKEDFKKIAKLIPCRTWEQIKNRYHSRIKDLFFLNTENVEQTHQNQTSPGNSFHESSLDSETDKYFA